MKNELVQKHIGTGSDKIFIGEKTIRRPENLDELEVIVAEDLGVSKNKVEDKIIDYFMRSYRIDEQRKLVAPTKKEMTANESKFAGLSKEQQATLLAMLDEAKPANGDAS
jgi:hypothetical protein